MLENNVEGKFHIYFHVLVIPLWLPSWRSERGAVKGVVVI